ncbi:MFS transporter [Dactylosporangium sp. AC04546]|uniref:MFS transporter n=1 Tax=Dactylosporangium sp. AC04546 TaxID=2862460 RepID=UPI001EDD3DB6|nr:MFS transporter [Dactylosporangium sp. AC04546]WVK81819.1 MFS transporter [Dactylosporangium sp. AC04546]
MRFGGFGARYAVALAVDATGSGLLRPFLVLYGVSLLRLDAPDTGLALSAGLLAGLAVVPLVGRWIDAGARTAPVVATLLVRAAGVAVLLTADGFGAFLVAAVLLGLGNQCWPPAHAALVTALAPGAADTPLAAARALRNAGLGAGALLAAAAVTAGPALLRPLAALTGVTYLLAAALVASMRAPSLRAAAPRGPAAVSRGPAALRRADLGVVAPRETGHSWVNREPRLQDQRDGEAAGVAAAEVGMARGKGAGRAGLWVLNGANLPLALCFAVLEVALPVVLTAHLRAGGAWSAVLFAGNTVLVVALQVPLVAALAGRSRRAVFAWSGVLLAASYAGFWASPSAGVLAAWAVLYTLGEILYAGSGTALVTAAAEPARLGAELARWQLSTGVANAVAPVLLLWLLDAGAGPLWITLVVATLAGSAVAGRWGPRNPPVSGSSAAGAVTAGAAARGPAAGAAGGS